MLVRTLACAAAALVGSVVVAVPVARADFTLVSQDLTLNRPAGTVNFSLTFNQAPDFYSVAADGTPDNSFQVEFNGAIDPSTSLPDDLTAVVRGDEIHTADAVRVRRPTGEGGKGSGGWGPIVTAVPFDLTGNTVTFVVPAQDLGWTGGAWSANVLSLSHGELTAQQSITAIPAPPAFYAGLAGLTALAAWQWRQAVRRRASIA